MRNKRTRRAGWPRAAPRLVSDPLDAEAAREAALRLLDRSRKTKSGLERRLRERGYAEATIAAVIERLTRVGLVDDIEYARAWLTGRWGRRPSGWRVLEQQLRAKGIALEDIAAGRMRLEADQGQADETALAQRAIDKAQVRYRDLEPRVRRQRLYALLSRKGFDAEAIRAALGGMEEEGG